VCANPASLAKIKERRKKGSLGGKCVNLASLAKKEEEKDSLGIKPHIRKHLFASIHATFHSGSRQIVRAHMGLEVSFGRTRLATQGAGRLMRFVRFGYMFL
jgi:hypothetical protein